MVVRMMKRRKTKKRLKSRKATTRSKPCLGRSAT